MEKYEGNTAGADVAADAEQDDYLRKQMESTITEAADRVTFHRVELERYERIGRAAGQALVELNATAPVAKADPADFVPHQPQQSEPSFR